MPLVFGATLLISATLLFWIQLLVARLVLPLLGGAPAVWNTCMVFFQAVLLVGYLYAHALARRGSLRVQTAVHLTVILGALPLLPISLRLQGAPPTATNPVPWLLLLLLVSAGIPAFAVSATAPLLQSWFSRTEHPAAADPYFLYAASNLGSMAALVAYPTIIELTQSLDQQGRTWAGGYALLAALIGVCAVTLWRPGRGSSIAPSLTTLEAHQVPGAREIAWWVVLAFVPSSLLLGVSFHITNDIAAVPLLWILPLALYLLSFVVVFSRRPVLRHSWMLALQTPLMLAALAVSVSVVTQGWISFPLHLLAFFATSLVCHGELVRRRPNPRFLTSFYLWISVGGVLGGIFNVLVAPLVFPTVMEYWLMLAVALLLRPASTEAGQSQWFRWTDVALPLALGIVLGGGLLLLRHAASTQLAVAGQQAGLLLGAAACWFLRRRPLRLALGYAALLTVGHLSSQRPASLLTQERNFFGVVRVFADPERRFHMIRHGNVIHGVQRQDPILRHEPLAYYTVNGPLGNIFAAVRPLLAGREIAVIGLGAGSAAAYAQPGERWTFYEIDPAVERIAKDTRLFTFLADAKAPVKVVIGDARLRLAEVAEPKYALLIVDAFSSDAIPVHLITREALQVYLSRLADDGVIAFHISNHYLEFTTVLHALAGDARLLCLQKTDERVAPLDAASYAFSSTWVVMTRRPKSVERLGDYPPWFELTGVPAQRPWSDNFSNILSTFRWPPW